MPSLKRFVDLAVVTLLAALTGASCGSPGGDTSSRSLPSTRDARQPTLASVERRPDRWQRLELRGATRRVDVYVARDDTPKPVVVLLHGSGCGPEFTRDPDGRLHETSVFQDAIEVALGTVHLAIVERPGVEPLLFPAGMSTADKQAAFGRAASQCSDELLTHATKTARVGDATAALGALSREPWVQRVIVAGHSEGTHVVTGLLREPAMDRVVAAAGLFGGAGPIPFFGGYVARPERTRADFDRVFERVRTVQQLQDDAMWEGLPGRRWRTFWLDSTPIEDVRDSYVPMFVGQGSADGSTVPADLFALEAIRQRPSRPLRYVVVEGANHAFEAPPGRSRMPELFADFLHWALDDERQTGLGLLK